MKKLQKMVTVLMLGVFLLAGCKSEAPTMTQEAPAGSTNEAATSETETSGEAVVEAGTEVNLKLFIPQPRFREQYEAFLAKFIEYYKNEKGVTVTYDMEMPSADTAAEILKTRLATGDDLDVFVVHAINEIPQYYKAGYLEDLSSEEWASTLYDSAKTAVTIDDKVVALPLESLVWGILYNKDIYNSLGLKPALTLSELAANTDAIEAAGYTGFLSSYNESWIPQLFLPLTTGAYVNSTNPDFLDKMYANNDSFASLSDMFQVIDYVHAHTNANGLEIGGTDGCAEFAAGNYGMWVQGPWFSSTILESNPEFNLGVAPLPVSEDPNQAMINASVSTSLVVSSFSKNKEVAKDLVAYFLDPSVSTEFYTSCQFNPISTVHDFETSVWIDEAISYMEAGKAYVDPSIPQAVKDESGKMLQAYYSGAVSQEDVIKALDDAWKTFNDVNQ